MDRSLWIVDQAIDTEDTVGVVPSTPLRFYLLRCKLYTIVYCDTIMYRRVSYYLLLIEGRCEYHHIEGYRQHDITEL